LKDLYEKHSMIHHLASLAAASCVACGAAALAGAASPPDAAAAAISALAVLAWYALGARVLSTQPSWAASPGGSAGAGGSGSTNNNNKSGSRARSWLVQLLISTVLTLASLPSFAAVAAAMLAGDAERFVAITHADTPLTRSASIFFATATALDLAIGALQYAEHIQPLSGWLHHAVFVVMAYAPLTTRTCTAFVSLCVVELPTVVLALGSVAPAMRSDSLFGSLFLALRVAYTGIVLAWHWRLARERYLVAIVGFSFIFHCFWFALWVRGELRRRRRRLREAGER